MEMYLDHPTLETLPDEILLEICKYLLCNDILYSFFGLNHRVTQMITQYRQHVSLHKTSISKFHYLCVNVLPEIGYQIRSLVIDCGYSLLQNQLFPEYFGEKMSEVFPKLERISLVSFCDDDQLLAFLRILHHLEELIEIRLYNLTQLQEINQSLVVRSLFQGNNHRFTTIFLDRNSSSLSINDADRYLNILRLTITVETATVLPSLFLTVPNVHYLDVTIVESSSLFICFDKTKSYSLSYLTDFRLESIKQMWILEEFCLLLSQLPSVQHLSLILSTSDCRLTDGNIIPPSLPITIQQLNYAVHFFYDNSINEDDTIIASWPSSHPIACYFNDGFLFIHTLPWNFAYMVYFSTVGKMITHPTHCTVEYASQVQQVKLDIDEKFTFSKSLVLLAQCHQTRIITILIENNDNTITEEQTPVFHCSKLPQLLDVGLYGPIPSDLKYFSFILNVAPNLFRLDLPFNYLLKLFEDQQISHVLDQRITSMCIYDNDPSSSSIKLNEEHIPMIASTLSRLKDLYVNFAHLPCSSPTVPAEDDPNDLSVQNISEQSNVISSGSSESMLICLLTTFKEHHLISLCINAKFIAEIQTDPEPWLQTNSILCDQRFKAFYYTKLNGLFIWI